MRKKRNSTGEVRNIIISFKVNKSENNIILIKCTESNLNISEFLRKCVLEQKTITVYLKEEIEKLTQLKNDIIGVKSDLLRLSNYAGRIEFNDTDNLKKRLRDLVCKLEKIIL